MSEKRTMVVLGGGVEAVPIIRRVRELGYRAVVVDMNPNAPGFGVADELVLASCYHSSPTIEELRKAGVAPDGVMCAAVDAPLAAARVRRSLGLSGMMPEAALASQSKAWQIEALHEAGLPLPEFVIVPRDKIEVGAWLMTREEGKRTLEGAQSGDEWAVKQINAGAPLVIVPDGPLVVKPVDSRGGRGVIRVLPGTLTLWALKMANMHSSSGDILIEQWLDGPQLSTESIVVGGRVLFTAVALRNYARLDEFAPFCIEDGAEMPYGDEALAAECSALVERACRALGWDNLTVKGDLVIHGGSTGSPHGSPRGQVKIIELAARLSGGFFASHYIPLAYGIDLVGAAVRLAMGEQGSLAIEAALGGRMEMPRIGGKQFVSQRYCFAQHDQIGKRIDYIPDSKPTTAEFFSWGIKRGDFIRPVTSHPDRLGQAIAVGRTAEEARERAEKAIIEMHSELQTAKA